MKYKNTVNGEEMEYEEFKELCGMVKTTQKFSMFIESYSKEFGFLETANLIKELCQTAFDDGYNEAY